MVAMSKRFPLSSHVKLLHFMAEKSEEIWCAGWMRNLEEILAKESDISGEYYALQLAAGGVWIWPKESNLQFVDDCFFPPIVEGLEGSDE